MLHDGYAADDKVRESNLSTFSVAWPLMPGAYAPRLAVITTSPYGVASAVPVVAGVRT